MNKYDPFNLLRTKKESIGTPPGTLVYSGAFADVDIEIEIIIYDKDNLSIKTVLDYHMLSDILKDNKNKDNVVWVNIIGLHNQDIIRSIGDGLGIHPMDLEDVVHVSQWSKILDQNDYLFSVLKMIYLQENEIKHEHVSIVLKGNVVITFQETPGDVFDHVRKRLDSNNTLLNSKDSNYLFYSLLDAIVDEYIGVINNISLTFNEIEMQIVDGKPPNKEELYTLRKELLYFSNSLSPLIDSIRKFLVTENSFFPTEMKPYYSDLNDHLNQVFNSLKSYREMSNSLHEMHISNVSMKLNKTMMTLTIFSAIFIPLSFLAGVFGMNFKYLPGLDNANSFFIFIAFCVLLAAGMISYFKIKKWF